MKRKYPANFEFELVPNSTGDVLSVARQCRKIVMRRALVSAGASVIPLPGLDIAVDIGMLTRMISEINAAFGLSAEQIERLSPKKKQYTYKAIMVVGSSLIGRIITRDLVISVLKTVGIRMSASQIARYVPFVGQVAAASLSFGAMKYLGDQHVADCVRVANTLLGIEFTPTEVNEAQPADA